MWISVAILFSIQAIAMLFDEGYFHIRRGLPKWERVGHPVDTFSYLICMSIVLFTDCTPFTMTLYILFSIISCLLITKDEFVHKDLCPAEESWLHALLFILHPIALIVTGLIWPVIQHIEMPSLIMYWLNDPEKLNQFIIFQYSFIWIFFFYQIIFWNMLWKNSPVK